MLKYDTRSSKNKRMVINLALLNCRISVYKRKPVRVKSKATESKKIFAIHASEKDVQHI